MKDARQDSREPPDAGYWPEIRRACERKTGRNCEYPWGCRCTPPVEILTAIESEKAA